MECPPGKGAQNGGATEIEETWPRLDKLDFSVRGRPGPRWLISTRTS